MERLIWGVSGHRQTRAEMANRAFPTPLFGCIIECHRN
jgi:hypothetical protein